MSTPLSLDTADFIRTKLEQLDVKLTPTEFAAILSDFHDSNPHFVEDLLKFLENCDNAHNFVILRIPDIGRL